MRRLDRVTAVLLSCAAVLSLILSFLAFVLRLPVRNGSHDLVRIPSRAYTEVPVVPQTYFQKYGPSELALLCIGFLLVVIVTFVLQKRTHREEGAGAIAWCTSIGCVMLGTIGFVTVAPYLILVGILLVLACSRFSRRSRSARRGTSDPASSAIGATH